MLFTDAVTYTKSVSNSIWAIFSCVVELPPIVRCSFENIIFHSLWAGDDVDRYNIRILGFIADNPARSKVLNCMQFNGYYGCLMCLHPTRRNSKNSAQIYLYLLKLVAVYMELRVLHICLNGSTYQAAFC